jgi:hypothetical protein
MNPHTYAFKWSDALVLQRNIVKKPPSDGVRPRLLKTLRSKRWVMVLYSLTISNRAALVWHPNSGPAVIAARQHEGTCGKTQQEDGEQQSRGQQSLLPHPHAHSNKARQAARPSYFELSAAAFENAFSGISFRKFYAIIGSPDAHDYSPRTGD